MKAIYTVYEGKIYRINQNTAIPTINTFKASGVKCSLKEDVYNKEVAILLSINTLNRQAVKSNKQLYNEMIDYIKEQKITEIPVIQNFFKIYLDYSIFEDDKEIEHQTVINNVAPEDKIIPLGVATNNETVYRRVKTFTSNLEFRTKTNVPFGIKSSKIRNYKFKINNLAIFEDFSESPIIHNSLYSVAVDADNNALKTTIDNMAIIYSTMSEGVEIDPIETKYIPRAIKLNYDLILTNYIVAYNDADVDKVLKEIIDEKYSGTTETDTDTDIDPGTETPDEGILVPEEETNPSSDGDYDPDEQGNYDYYDISEKNTPKSLLVVEDLISDNLYNPETMIKKSLVINDIPEIEVGQYVIYRHATYF